jgi:hypothetical protein
MKLGQGSLWRRWLEKRLSRGGSRCVKSAVSGQEFVALHDPGGPVQLVLLENRGFLASSSGADDGCGLTFGLPTQQRRRFACRVARGKAGLASDAARRSIVLHWRADL